MMPLGNAADRISAGLWLIAITLAAAIILIARAAFIANGGAL